MFSRNDSFQRWARAITLTWITCFAPQPSWADPPSPAIASEQRLIELGTGDSITIQVYGQPDMTITVYISDDGTMPVPLVGSVRVAGLSPSEAAKQIEKALQDGGYLVDPHVTLTVLQTRSQRVSVLGEVRTPGRFSVESNTTIFDLLALAGGATELGADVAYVLRPTPSGGIDRIPLNIQNLSANENYLSDFKLKTGDSVFVPKAEKFYILGAVRTPNTYKLHPGTTVLQAIAIGGGLTEAGSERRIEIKRKQKDGKVTALRGHLSDEVQPDDVIRVKESIF